MTYGKMPNLVNDPRARFGFTANYNPALRMNNGTIHSMKFKIDQERAKYNKTIKLINRNEKMEMRITKKQMEEVKQELTLLRAYQHVAKQTAFKRFDPVIRRRRELREKRRLEEEDAALERLRQEEGEDSDDEIDEDSRPIIEENRRLSMKGNVFITLGDIVGNDAVLRRKSQEIMDMRRKSSSSETLDYGDGSSSQRRSSWKSLISPRVSRRGSAISGDGSNEIKIQNKQYSLSPEDAEDESKNSGGSMFDIVGELTQMRRKSRAGSFGLAELDSIQESSAESVVGKNSDVSREMKNASVAMNETNRLMNSSNVNTSVNSLIDDSSNNLKISGKEAFRRGSFLKGFFITRSEEETGEHDDDKKEEILSEIHTPHNDKPMSIYQISKFYEQQKTRQLEEGKNKALKHQKKLEQMKYEGIKRRLQQETFQKGNNSRKAATSLVPHKSVSAPDTRAPISHEGVSSAGQDRHNHTVERMHSTKHEKHPYVIPKLVEPSNDTDTPVTSGAARNEHDNNSISPALSPSRSNTDAISPTGTSSVSIRDGGSTSPALTPSSGNDQINVSPTIANLSKMGLPLKGLARFRNAANAVSIQVKIAKGNKNNRLKTLAAAIVMKKNTTAGRIPKAFMYNSCSVSDRSNRSCDANRATSLEASHRKPDECKIRPLAMPEGIKMQYQEKWKELMANVNGAVHWKVRALREDTGTLNTRQLRRQNRDNNIGVTRSSSRSVFPGACKTTWAMKKYVSQEVDEVLQAWRPDNLRKQRNQKMKDKVSLPEFIDRIKTTASILSSFRNYRKDTERKGDRDDDDDDDDDDGINEEEYDDASGESENET